MAVNRAPATKAGEGEQSEREYQATINDAIRDTEGEIAASAFDEDEPENDGDTSLEEIGEGLEGEVEDDAEEEVDGEGEEEAEGDAEDGDGEEAGADEGEEGEQPEEQPRDQRGQFRDREPAVPPGRLREQTQRATAAEERAQALERQVAEMNGRLAEISARTNAPPQRQAEAPPPKPDPFSDPEGYERWVFDQAERRAESKLEQRFSQFEQRQQQREAQRVDESLAVAARGERAFEFGAAYNALTSLDPRSPQSRSTVARIYNAADPAAALFDWWEQNGGPEYRERVYEQVAPRVQRNGNGARQPQRQSFDQNAQPRHVIRGPQRLPSLNSATGSNSQRVSDPEALDGSERAIFEYGTRR
jgi:hypothetical protein